MSDERQLTAMHRKAGAGRPPPEIGRATAATALRVAVAQAAEDVAALVALAASVDEKRTVRETFVEELPEHALLALCEGPESRFGMVVIDPQALAALIEVQTTGRVVPHKAEPRAPTRTDAILSADFINRLQEVFAEMAAEADLPVLPAIEGFRYALPLSDARAVSMTLEDIPYRQFTLTLDMGGGAKEGQLQLLFPYDPPRRRPADGEATETLAETVMDSQAEMQVVLHRLDMPLQAVRALTVGQLMPVPQEALSSLVLEGVTGEQVSVGRLGQVNGHRAVRIVDEAASREAGSVAAPMPAIQEAPAGLDMPPAMPDPISADPGLPPLGGDGLPPLGGDGLPPLGGGDDLPPLGGGDLPPLGDIGGLGDLDSACDVDGLPPLDPAPMAIGDLPEPVT